MCGTCLAVLMVLLGLVLPVMLLSKPSAAVKVCC
jgi:hypothetical protein